MPWLYSIEHRTSGAIYVGQTSELDPKRRWRGHKANRKHPQSRFQYALRKYGPDAFEWRVVQWFDTTPEVELAEVYWIAYLRAMDVRLYNISDGGRAPMLGRKHSAEAKAKVSQRNKGQKRSVETRARMSAAQMGRTVSEEMKARLRELRRGIPPTNKGQKQGPLSPEAKARQIEDMRKAGPNRGAFKKGTTPHNKGVVGQVKASEETRRKMSETQRTVTNTGRFQKGQRAHNKKYDSPEAKLEAKRASRRAFYHRHRDRIRAQRKTAKRTLS